VFESEDAVNSKLSSSYRTWLVSTGLYTRDMSHTEYESYLIIVTKDKLCVNIGQSDRHESEEKLLMSGSQG
jgi:hypothetical protein